MSDRPRPHGPMGDGVFTRCRVCMCWWPCPTRLAEDRDAVVDAEHAAEFIAEAREALRPSEQGFDSGNVVGTATASTVPSPWPTPASEE